MQKVNQVHVLQTSKVGWTHFGPAHPKKREKPVGLLVSQTWLGST